MIKKKLCIWGLFAILLSCSYELDNPPPFNETSLKRFNVTEARRYFEEGISVATNIFVNPSLRRAIISRLRFSLVLEKRNFPFWN